MLSEEQCTPSLEIQRPPTLPVNMDDTELGELFASCMPRLAKTAKHIMRNSPDSEDVLQEGLLSAFQNLSQFQGRSKFSTWLHSIIKNAAKMHVRKKATHLFFSLEDKLSESNGALMQKAFRASTLGPEEVCAQNERSQILRMALRGLPPMYQRIIELCDIHGLGGRDAAETLGLSTAAFKTCLHRARRAASRRIRESCLPRGCSSAEERQIGSQQRKTAFTRAGTSQACRKEFPGDSSPSDSTAQKAVNAAGVSHERRPRSAHPRDRADTIRVPGNFIMRNIACAACQFSTTESAGRP